jgi:hypothetical protein
VLPIFVLIYDIPILLFVSQSVCGVWTNDDDLWSELEDVSKTTEEKSWVSSMLDIRILVIVIVCVCVRERECECFYFPLSARLIPI